MIFFYSIQIISRIYSRFNYPASEYLVRQSPFRIWCDRAQRDDRKCRVDWLRPNRSHLLRTNQTFEYICNEAQSSPTYKSAHCDEPPHDSRCISSSWWTFLHFAEQIVFGLFVERVCVFVIVACSSSVEGKTQCIFELINKVIAWFTHQLQLKGFFTQF